jgi:hypothetical protein
LGSYTVILGVADDVHTFGFEHGVVIEVRHPHYDAQRRLWGEIVARLDDIVVNRAQINLLDQRQRVDFHGLAMGMDGLVDWQDHLLSVIGLVQEALLHQEQSEETAAATAIIAPVDDPVLPFPVEVLPAPLAALVKEGAAALPCPLDFIAVPMLAVLGVAIGTSRGLEIKPRWVEGPRINSAVVADPGSKKSPALALAMAPLYARQEQYQQTFADAKRAYEAKQADYEIQEATWREARKTKQANRRHRPQRPDEPIMAQIWVSDTTLEAFAELLERNPRGVIMARDELTGWTRSMNQFKGGKGADRQAWLSFWNGAPVMVNRKNRREPILLTNPMVCVTGCLPPEVLTDLTDERGREDGFMHRMLFSYPDPVPLEYTETYVSEGAVAGYATVVDMLLTMGADSAAIHQLVTMTPSGREAFRTLLRELYATLNDPECPQQLRGPIAKLEGYAARLALILQMSRKAAGETTDEVIGPESVEGAAALVRYFLSHARRVYAQLRTTPEDRQVWTALRWIKARGSTTVRAVQMNGVAGVKSASEAKGLLAKLQDRGYGTVKEGPGKRVSFFLHLT